MSFEQAIAYRTVKPITISYSDLTDKERNLSDKIEEALGPKGLGIILISDVYTDLPLSLKLDRILPLGCKLGSYSRENIVQPNQGQRLIDVTGILNFFPVSLALLSVPFFFLSVCCNALEKRSKEIIHFSSFRVASLHDDVKVSLEGQPSRFGIGWSCGDERLESNKVDIDRGSFSANPILDVPTTDVSLMQRYPSFCCPNKWPSSALPELEGAFKALGKMIFDVGLKLAFHCDKYVSKTMMIVEDEGIEKIIKRSRCHKARLLYYFPKQKSECMEDSKSISSWAGWHTDFSCLTGLTSGMFVRNTEVVGCPDSAGLYIKARNAEIVKVVFGEDELAYQIGDTLEIISGGRLCATPHCVRAPSLEEAAGVARSSFAMFMQPDWLM
ncbi:uncharacterized protein A4U43_C02F13510 [Asparagus officinalis]|uniref:Uncharacterized protein n=1 Tax=Asparagus officinalis TaxID=4686 RepID=A0A5P1FIW4_ASPOF|nr:uncharacterized protein A4U43_C02F13510 [Asparagus officinalis]